MRTRASRLEFTIAFIGILALFVCSRPPQPGTAKMRGEPDRDALEGRSMEDGPPEAAAGATVDQGTFDRDSWPSGTRMGRVDARNCDLLDYDKVMYGEVTVRWVWDGTRFAPQKVCIVEEENGVSSVWSFDQQEDVILSEIPSERR
jgi:hypothetical protein